MSDELTLRRELAKRWGVQTATIAKWDREGRGVGPVIYLSKTTAAYRTDDVEKFEAARDSKRPVFATPPRPTEKTEHA